jgi:transcriptional regulator with XRE-family HTH domain
MDVPSEEDVQEDVMHDEWHRAFCQNLTRLRTSAGLTQQELARRAGMDHSVIRRVESGERGPQLLTVFKLAAALGVHPSTLLR